MDPDLIQSINDIPMPILYDATDGASLKGIYLSWKTLAIDNRVSIYRADSIDGEYQVVDLAIENNYALDTNTIPNKKYYYKIKVFYFGLGESGFSNIDSGFRAGSGVDIYESDDLSSDAKEFVIGSNPQLRSIYPENDIDWIKVKLDKENYYMIESLSSGVKKNDIAVAIAFFDSGLNLILQTAESLESKIGYFYPVESGYYFLKVTSKDTGDYKLNIYKRNIAPLLSGEILVSKGTSSNFIKLSWNTPPNTLEYEIYRGESLNGIYDKIQVTRDKNSYQKFDTTKKNYCYDRDILVNKNYYYKVKAKNNYGESYFARVDNGFMKDISSDTYEPNNDIFDAKVIEVGKRNYQLHTVYPANDIDYVKFVATAGESYSIEVYFSDIEIDNAVVTLFDSDNKLLEKSYTRNNQNGLFKITNWYCDTGGSYFVKVNLTNEFIASYKMRVILYKDDKNINDF